MYSYKTSSYLLPSLPTVNNHKYKCFCCVYCQKLNTCSVLMFDYMSSTKVIDALVVAGR